MAGRTRLRVLPRQRDAEFFARVQSHLLQLDGVDHVETNALTASVLIVHHLDADELVRRCEAAGLFTLCTPTGTVTPLATQVYTRARTATRAFASMSDGRVDLAALAFVTLVGLAIHQGRRGQLLGPAVTLLFQAVTALSLSNRGTKN